MSWFDGSGYLRKHCHINHANRADTLQLSNYNALDAKKVKRLPCSASAAHSLCFVVWQARVCHRESTGTYCVLSVFPSGGASFDFTSGTCSDRSQMIRDDSKPSWLIPPEWLAELWEHSYSSHSSPSAVLEGPLQRAGQSPVQSPVPCPAHSSPPRGLI